MRDLISTTNEDWTRRQYLAAAFIVMAGACAGGRAPSRGVGSVGVSELAALEAKVGGRVGVFALDTGTDREVTHRPDERFAMCSTFKWLLAANVLMRIERGELSLTDRVPYTSQDVLEYAPVAREHVAEGSMTVETLAQAAVTVSDNTAANLLLARCGGPSSVTQFARSLGDTVTRLDRNEPALNRSDPGDPRDTTTPRAMVGLMRHVLCGEILAPAGRERILAWLSACQTGKARLRAGLPATWKVGDKTGSGPQGRVNDLAIAVPPGRPPILIAAYASDGSGSLERLEAAHAEIGRLVARTFS